MLGYIVKVLLIAVGSALRALDMLENRYHRIFRKGLYGLRGRTTYKKVGERLIAEPDVDGTADGTGADRPARIA